MNSSDFVSKKITSRCPQSGRSMIEMLGVLAIIGVLSVGGIAGYSKAMQKYRINKTIEQISMIASNFNTFFAQQKSRDKGLNGNHCSRFKNSGGNNALCPIIKKAKLVPDEILTLDSSGNITAMTNAFGGDLLIEADYNFYGIALTDLSAEACIDIATQDWNSITSSGYKGTVINDTEKEEIIKPSNIWETLSYFSNPSCSAYASYGAISFSCGIFSIENAITACSCKSEKCAIVLAFAVK